MATRKNIQKASNLDKPEKFQLSEVGYSGNRMFDGVTQEETIRDLNFPNSLTTFREMSYHPAVNTPLSLYNSMISKAKFRIIPPKDASKKEKKQAEILETMFDDMETPMEDVVVDIMTMAIYGFSVIEKVYRRREKSKGSAYDDGLIGIKKLALRNQESIDKFIFDKTGNDVIGVKQDISRLNDPYKRFANRLEMQVILPKSKFMLFNVGRNRTNPYGTSPLRDVYLPWKYLTTVEELEASGVAKDLQGTPILYIPAQYMSEDASTEQKAIYEQFKRIIRNIQQNSQSGVILPSATDPDTRQPLFKLELLSTEGGKKNYNTTEVKDYYRTMIFIGMNADILLMGNTQTGSFALGSIKTSLTGAFVESMLKNIVRIFNDDLIRQVYELNGWDISRRCMLDYEGFEDVDLESFSKAVQRIGAVGYLPKNIEVINKILTSMNIDTLDEEANLDELLPQDQSKAGQGMESGLNSGTGNADGSSGNDTTSNMDNNG